MIDPRTIGDHPPPEARHQRPPLLWHAIADVCTHRRFVWALTRRDFVARYKQTWLGVGWAVVIPFLTIVVFTVFVQRFAKVETGGAPYPVWSFVGLLPWMFFSNATSAGSMSMLGNRSLLNKISAPRAIYPLGAVLLAAIDIAISGTVLAVVFLIYRYPPSHLFWMAPLIAVVHVLFVVAVVLALSVLVVYVRDIRNAIPVILQLGLFATPVVYPLTQIPNGFRLFYCAVNPLGPVIDSYRRVLLYGEYPNWTWLAIAAASTTMMFLASFTLFARFERGIVDIL